MAAYLAFWSMNRTYVAQSLRRIDLAQSLQPGDSALSGSGATSTRFMVAASEGRGGRDTRRVRGREGASDGVRSGPRGLAQAEHGRGVTFSVARIWPWEKAVLPSASGKAVTSQPVAEELPRWADVGRRGPASSHSSRSPEKYRGSPRSRTIARVTEAQELSRPPPAAITCDGRAVSHLPGPQCGCTKYASDVSCSSDATGSRSGRAPDRPS